MATILVVDDDPRLVQYVSKHLGSRNHKCLSDMTGKKVFDILSNQQVDLIILDIMIPDCSGFEICRKIRTQSEYFGLPVLFLSSMNGEEEIQHGLAQGADDYLGKPFHIEELLVRLTALLHRTNQIPGATVNIGGLLLDEERQTITIEDGQEHLLTGIEFRLLRYMLLNPGKVLSKSKLTEHIYDFDSDKDSNVIEVYIRRLRQLLGKHRIETRRNQGYVLKES